MKDRRKLLKIGAITEFFYILITFIVYISKFKLTDEFIANTFLLSISLCFTIIMYKLSKKEVSELENKRILLTITSIWLLFDVFLMLQQFLF